MPFGSNPAMVPPHIRKHLYAGPIDWDTHQPEYSISLNTPGHVAEQVKGKRMIDAGKTRVFFEIQNDSDWVAFVSLFRGGEAIPFTACSHPVGLLEDFICSPSVTNNGTNRQRGKDL